MDTESVVLTKKVLFCDNCGDEIQYCWNCEMMFTDGDEIICQSFYDEHKHIHKTCKKENK